MGDVEVHLLYIMMSTNRSYRKVDKHCNYRISASVKFFKSHLMVLGARVA